MYHFISERNNTNQSLSHAIFNIHSLLLTDTWMVPRGIGGQQHPGQAPNTPCCTYIDTRDHGTLLYYVPPPRDTQLPFDMVFITMLYTCLETEVVYYRGGGRQHHIRKKFKTLYSLTKKCPGGHKSLHY